MSAQQGFLGEVLREIYYLCGSYEAPHFCAPETNSSMVRVSRYAHFTYEQWLDRARKYCASRERCTSDVQLHLERSDCPQDTIDTIVELLRQENYLDDFRYAVQFAQARISKKAWGELKIRHALQARRISREVIEKALDHLQAEGTRPDLYSLIVRKLENTTVQSGDTMLAARLLRFAYSRGFHQEEAQHVVRRVLSEQGYLRPSE